MRTLALFKRGVVLLLVVLGFLGITAASASAADEKPTAVTGIILSTEDTGIPDVTVIATNDDGFTGETTTDADGAWLIELPKGGSFTVSVDIESLPEGQDRSPDTRKVTVFDGSTVKVLFPPGDASEKADTGRSAWETLVALAADGLMFGMIIALAALGLSLVYGTTGLTNFAHGEMVTLGALLTLIFNNTFELPFVVAAALAIILSAGAGWLQDRGIWRPLRKKGISVISMMIVSIGLAILVRYVYLYFWGGATIQFREYSGQAGLEIGPVTATPKALIGAGLALITIISVAIWLLKSKIGKASRAVSDNPSLASSSGIDVQKVVSVIWILGGGLAGFAGILYSLNNGWEWMMGFKLLLLIFAGVILGGIGTAFGALLGSIVVGLFLQLSTFIIPSEMKNIGAMGILIIILLVRPQGLLGRRERIG